MLPPLYRRLVNAPEGVQSVIEKTGALDSIVATLRAGDVKMVTKALQIITQLIVNAKDRDFPSIEMAIRRGDPFGGSSISSTLYGLLRVDDLETGIATEVLILTNTYAEPPRWQLNLPYPL